MALRETHTYEALVLVAISLAVVIGLVVKLLAMRRALAQSQLEGEAHFRMLADALPEMVWTAVSGRGIDYMNQRWCELTGQPVEQALGFGWKEVIHPDDLAVALQSWEKSRQSGIASEMEYRLRSRDGGYRWHLVRARVMRDSSGAMIKWIGTNTDIEDRRHTQQGLEDQIKQHTADLMEANARLETEMRQRALAQQELNQQNERMLKELTRRSRRATLLAKMAELLQSCADLKDVFSIVAGMAPKVFPEFRGTILLLNSSRKMLEMAVQWSDCQLPAPVFEPQDCWALRTGHVHVVPAGDLTAPCAHTHAGKYAYFCVPLLSQGEAVGILHFQLSQPREPVESELSFSSTFAEQIGLSIANIRLREALRNQSIRDPLTTLYNRRYLEETMERETRRAVRAEHGLGVLVLDLDHFKTFNDTYGHEAGDAVLREFASFLSRSVRAEDIVCRYGGGEFVVVLPMADIDASQARAERICAKLRELPVLHRGRSVGKVTVSVGVAVLPANGTSPKELLEAADAALYRAKREGRDRVMLAEGPAAVAVAREAGAPGATFAK